VLAVFSGSVWLDNPRYTKNTAQHHFRPTPLRRLLAEGKRAQTGLLLKVVHRTRRAPEPYR